MFDRKGFMEYLQETFDGFDNSFLRETINKIIDYGESHYSHSLDQLCNFLYATIAEIEFGEIAMFMDDSQLTSYGRKEKKIMLKKMELKKYE